MSVVDVAELLAGLGGVGGAAGRVGELGGESPRRPARGCHPGSWAITPSSGPVRDGGDRHSGFGARPLRRRRGTGLRCCCRRTAPRSDWAPVRRRRRRSWASIWSTEREHRLTDGGAAAGQLQGADLLLHLGVIRRGCGDHCAAAREGDDADVHGVRRTGRRRRRRPPWPLRAGWGAHREPPSSRWCRSRSSRSPGRRAPAVTPGAPRGQAQAGERDHYEGGGEMTAPARAPGHHLVEHRQTGEPDGVALAALLQDDVGQSEGGDRDEGSAARAGTGRSSGSPRGGAGRSTVGAGNGRSGPGPASSPGRYAAAGGRRGRRGPPRRSGGRWVAAASA